MGVDETGVGEIWEHSKLSAKYQKIDSQIDSLFNSLANANTFVTIFRYTAGSGTRR